MKNKGNSFSIGRWALRSPATACFHLALLIILIGACVTWISGVNGSVTLIRGQHVKEFLTDEGEMGKFPFALSLDSCMVEYHEATTAPKDFVSVLTVTRGERSEIRRVSMNKVLEIDGFRFCQKAMGEDETTLTVNHDPWGIAVTYTGYFLLFGSSALMLAGWLLKSLRKRRRSLAIAFSMLVCFYASGGRVANDFSELRVYWGERVAPAGSMAADILNRVYGKSEYKGKSATEVMLGWLFDYDSWKREPIIKVKGEKVKKALGIDGQYARLIDFFGPEGYKLQPLLSDIGDKGVQEANERVMLITALCTGQLLRIFPYKSALGRQEWLSHADMKPSKMELPQWVFITRSVNDLARSIALGDREEALSAIGRIRNYQKEQLPGLSERKLHLELCYYKLNKDLLPACIAIIAGIIGWILCRRRGSMVRIATGTAACVLFLWLSAMIAMRWIIAGHIPLSNGYETMQAMGWIAAGCASVACWRRPYVGAMLLLVGGMALMVNVMSPGDATLSPLLPVLASPLLSVHVLLVMTAYTLLALVMLNSLYALTIGSPDKRTAAIALSLKVLRPAVVFLACGIFVGAIWANQSWGRYWGWDPKETWALITLLIYSLPLHRRLLHLMRKPLWLNLYLSIAFLSVVMTYFGVNFLLGGMHSYA